MSAHTRIRSDGSEVFVGEHLRWNRARSGRTATRAPRSVEPLEVPDEQLGLFDPDR